MHSTHTKSALSACLALFAALPGQALAGGYYYSDSGIVATGRGGAWVAGANTQFAQWYNPAGLIRIEKPTVNAGWSGVQQNVRFTRMRPEPDEDGNAFYDPVDNQAKPFNIPQLGFAAPIRDDLAIAFGLYTPFAPSSKYPEDGPQRYSVKETTILQGSFGPSMAWRPRFLPQVVLGAGANIQFLSVSQSLDITWTGQDNPGGDIAVDLGVRDLMKLGWNAGLLIEPVEQISIGLSIVPPMRFNGRGTATIDFSGNTIEGWLEESRYVDPDVTALVQLPLVLRAGVAVRPTPKLEIEGAVVFQRWSRMPDIVVTDVDVALQIDESSILAAILPEDQRRVDDDFIIPQNLVDTVSYRLGAEYRALPELAVRAGGFWEPSAVPTRYVDVALVDAPKIQIGGGASLFLLNERLRIDGALAFLFLDALQVRDSERRQTDAGVIDGVDPLVVGNGDYRSNGWIVGLQAQWAFGAGG